MTALTTTATRRPVRTEPRKPRRFTYMRYELLRAFRNKRFMIFSLGFPILLFFLIAGPNRHEQLGGINFATRYMVGMLSWGAMTVVLGAGSRIVDERSVGWHRQLRITPLSTRTYFATKIVSGYAVAVLTMAALFGAGIAIGVHLSAAHWFQLTGYVLIGLIPFAVLGIVLGHLLTVDSMGPAMGGITSLLAILGGAWGPLASGGFILAFAKLLPSYWLVQASNSVVGGDGWPLQAWIVIAVWTAAATRLAVWAYRRDAVRI